MSVTLHGHVIHKLRTLVEYQAYLFELGPQDSNSQEVLTASEELIRTLIKKIEAADISSQKKKKKKAKCKHG